MIELLNLYSEYLTSGRSNSTFINTLNVTFDPTLLNAQNAAGETLLHIAAIHQDIDTVRLLLEKKVDVHLKDKHRETALWHCLKQTPLNILLIGLLLIHGANIDDTNRFGQTALLQAILDDDKQKVEQLLKLGANVSAPNYVINTTVYTPLSLALTTKRDNKTYLFGDPNKISNRLAIIKLLLKHSPIISQDFTELTVPETFTDYIICIGSKKFLGSTHELYGLNDDAEKTATDDNNSSHQDSTQRTLAILNAPNPSLTATPAQTNVDTEKKLQRINEAEKELRLIIDAQDPDDQPYVHRRMKGFKDAITNVKEFEETISKGIVFDYKAIERATADSKDEQVKSLHAKVTELLTKEDEETKKMKKSPQSNLEKYIAHFLAEHCLFPNPKNTAAKKYQFGNLAPTLLKMIEDEEIEIIREHKQQNNPRGQTQ